jgi:hypothetical protein
MFFFRKFRIFFKCPYLTFNFKSRKEQLPLKEISNAPILCVDMINKNRRQNSLKFVQILKFQVSSSTKNPKSKFQIPDCLQPAPPELVEGSLSKVACRKSNSSNPNMI